MVDEQSRGGTMRRFALPALGIMFVVVFSNVLVQFHGAPSFIRSGT